MLRVWKVEHYGRADQLRVDVLDLAGGQGTVGEVFVAVLFGGAADQSGEG